MPIQDTSEIKEKILRILRMRGPSLPVHVAKEINQSILLTSVFLSELFSEKKIKLSNLRVGSSPVYFIQGQEPQLERFSNHLKSKEKDAFILLKGKKFLKDSEQQPAIRVALREVRDFAVPFKQEDEIYWRYFTANEDEFTSQLISKPSPILPSSKVFSQLITSQISEQAPASEPKVKQLEIFDKPKKRVVGKKKIPKKLSSQKKNDRLFDKVKEHLTKKSIELLDIESFSKNELVLKVRDKETDKLVISFNKKRIDESDLIRANKKATELKLPYIVLSLGEPLKKLRELIEAAKNLSDIEKME